MVRPLTAWLYLLGLLGLAILLEGRSPAPGLGLWTSILATVVVGYDLNRRSEGKRANWWIVAAILLGPLALIAYSYWRRGRSRGVPTMPAGTSPPSVPPPPPAPPAAWYAAVSTIGPAAAARSARRLVCRPSRGGTPSLLGWGRLDGSRR